MRIGAAFCNTNDDGKQYISLVIDEEFKEMFPFLKKFKFSMPAVPADKRTSDKSPDYYINMYIPKENKEEF